MRILGIDSATPTASVALIENDQLIAEEFFGPTATSLKTIAHNGKGNHAEILLPLLQSVLARAEIKLADISGIAVTVGPGSFTGLRIALATVKGLAYECGLPVVGVSTLHANAARVRGGHSGLICAMLDARKQEVYCACFRATNNSLARVSEDRVCSLGAALGSLRAFGSEPMLMIGDGAHAYQAQIVTELGSAICITSGAEFSTVAAAAARIALAKLCAGESDSIGALTPVYLRPSEAQRKIGVSPLNS